MLKEIEWICPSDWRKLTISKQWNVLSLYACQRGIIIIIEKRKSNCGSSMWDAHTECGEGEVAKQSLNENTHTEHTGETGSSEQTIDKWKEDADFLIDENFERILKLSHNKINSMRMTWTNGERAYVKIAHKFEVNVSMCIRKRWMYRVLPMNERVFLLYFSVPLAVVQRTIGFFWKF